MKKPKKHKRRRSVRGLKPRMKSLEVKADNLMVQIDSVGHDMVVQQMLTQRLGQRILHAERTLGISKEDSLPRPPDLSLAQRCQDLAAAVLAHEPEINDTDRRSDLAQNIEEEIEAWLSCERAVNTAAAEGIEKRLKAAEIKVAEPARPLRGE